MTRGALFLPVLPPPMAREGCCSSFFLVRPAPRLSAMTGRLPPPLSRDRLCGITSTREGYGASNCALGRPTTTPIFFFFLPPPFNSDEPRLSKGSIRTGHASNPPPSRRTSSATPFFLSPPLSKESGHLALPFVSQS